MHLLLPEEDFMGATIPPWIAATIIGITVLIAGVVGIGYARRAQLLPSTHPAKSAWLLIGGTVLAGWLLAAFILGSQGFFQASRSNNFPALLVAFIPLAVGYGLLLVSPTFRSIVVTTPPYWIIGVQVYRTIGALFLILYAGQYLPGVFAIPAGAGDLLVGSTAPIVAYLLVARHHWARSAAVLWNIAGIADLVLALTLGFLSAPTPFQLLAQDAPNVLITAFPLILIPAFAVPLSLLLHLFSLHGLRNPTREDHVQTGSRHAHV
jgi:hypothetical protein